MNAQLVVYLFESLLIESRIILCSNDLGKLSACVNGAVGLLNPFSWQHVFIPVLPNSMIDYCCAPMPFVIGILTSSLPKVLTMPIEEVFLLFYIFFIFFYSF